MNTYTRPRLRKGLNPTTPIGQPYRPVIKINESVTAVGDQTGTEYFRYGDNPNGPEAVEVTPPGQPGPSPMGRIGGPVSMATGGIALVGFHGSGSKYESSSSSSSDDKLIAQQLANNQARQSELARIYAARKDVGNLAAVGQADTLRRSEDYKYSAAGVATPAEIDVPTGYAGTLPAGTRARYRTQAEILAQEADEADSMRSLSLENARLSQPRSTSRSSSSSSDASSSDYGGMGRPRMSSSGSGFGETVNYAAKFQDTLAQVNAGRARLRKDSGYVDYVDPFTRRKYSLSPAEAAIRKQRDEEKLDEEYDKRYGTAKGELSKLSGNDLFDALDAGLVTNEEASSELVRRGYSAREANTLLTLSKPKTDAKSELGKISTADLLDAVAAEIVPPDEAIGELIRRGYSEREARALLELDKKKAAGTSITIPGFGAKRE